MRVLEAGNRLPRDKNEQASLFEENAVFALSHCKKNSQFHGEEGVKRASARCGFLHVLEDSARSG